MKKILFIILSLILWIGCYDEDPLTPTTEPEPYFLLPQGDHDFDRNIVNWNDRCGFYILYRFQPQDIYWNLTQWDETSWDSLSNKWLQNKFKAEPAKEEYVDQLLNFVETEFLNFYPDSALQILMPLKLLFCSELWEPYGTTPSVMDCYTGIDFIAINHGNESIMDMDADDRVAFKQNLHITFLERITDYEKISIPAEFKSISTYGENVDNTNMYDMGFLQPDGWTKIDAKKDWKSFLTAIVTTPYDDLTAEPAAWAWKYSMGILSDTKDRTHKIRDKYVVVIRYFKETFGIDLQKIGDSFKVKNQE
ncbi:MAG: hypothetical protein KH112_07770 [Sanguibacteroides justesenii]|jgi:putative lipoprotein|uniref:hypothetical protein n=1 Tax=Butyricimonas faecalis TaxID=2093856 RepID=UPI001E033068|nr:hypothetical protein [Sanguibacteroides justesenii]